MKQILTIICLLMATAVFGQDSIQKTSIHFQSTFVEQYHPPFHVRSGIGSGEKSLKDTTEFTLSSITTLYLGVKVWNLGEVYFNPEVAGGSGFSGATGIAGFPNGTTFRVGSPAPTAYIARLFFRQTIPLGKEMEYRESDFNKLGMMVPKERIVITFGKFSLSDIFDQNVTSHDPTSSLLNWSLMDAGAWDYPSNTRGYTYALSVKIVKKNYMMRFCSALNAEWSNGVVTEGYLPTIKNYTDAHGELAEITLPLKKDFSESIKFTFFANHDRAANYDAATKLINTAYAKGDSSAAAIQLPTNNPQNGSTGLLDGSSHLVSTALDNLRHTGGLCYNKFGFIVNWEKNLGKKNEKIFVRGSWNNGLTETWMYTEIDQSIAMGGYISGKRFNRPDDMIRFGLAVNGISKEHAEYL